MTFYHYTCDHGRAAIGDVGELLPARRLAPGTFPDDWWPADFIWMTDLRVPVRGVLGLTSYVQPCDRTAHRYVVTRARNVRPWMEVRHTVTDPHMLELAEGARPRHWYVARVPVPVTYAPRR